MERIEKIIKDLKPDNQYQELCVDIIRININDYKKSCNQRHKTCFRNEIIFYLKDGFGIQMRGE